MIKFLATCGFAHVLAIIFGAIAIGMYFLYDRAKNSSTLDKYINIFLALCIIFSTLACICLFGYIVGGIGFIK